MKNKIKENILKLFRAYEIETEFDGNAINERMYNDLVNDLVKLWDSQNNKLYNGTKLNLLPKI